MQKMMDLVAWAGLIVWLVGCSLGAAPPSSMGGAALAQPVTPMPAACPGPMAIVQSFYDVNDAGQFDTSLALLADDVTLDSWAQGINGHHMVQKHLAGKAQIRAVLSQRGLRRASGQPNDPIFHETDVRVSGNRVTFGLEPDRAHPDGRPYNPYAVEIVFGGCKIKSLTVIERIMWL